MSETPYLDGYLEHKKIKDSKVQTYYAYQPGKSIAFIDLRNLCRGIILEPGTHVYGPGLRWTRIIDN